MYKLLYSFMGEQILLFEVKRLDIESPFKEDIYFWYVYQKDTKVLKKLLFRGMETKGENQFRYFSDASLKFNTLSATYTEKETQIKLKTLPGNFLLPQEVIGLMVSCWKQRDTL